MKKNIANAQRRFQQSCGRVSYGQYGKLRQMQVPPQGWMSEKARKKGFRQFLTH